MKFTNRCLRALVYLAPTIIVFGILYIASYFVIMREIGTFNPRTGLPEFVTHNRFIEAKRTDDGKALEYYTSNWTNHFYSPLDSIFRPAEVAELKSLREDFIEIQLNP